MASGGGRDLHWFSDSNAGAPAREKSHCCRLSATPLACPLVASSRHCAYFKAISPWTQETATDHFQFFSSIFLMLIWVISFARLTRGIVNLSVFVLVAFVLLFFFLRVERFFVRITPILIPMPSLLFWQRMNFRPRRRLFRYYLNSWKIKMEVCFFAVLTWDAVQSSWLLTTRTAVWCTRDHFVTHSFLSGKGMVVYGKGIV